MKNSLNHLLIIPIILFYISCEEPEKKQEDVVVLNNTLEDADLGGKTGYISEYFYNFDDNVDVDFYRFTSSYFTFDFEQYLNLLQKEPVILSLRSFPEYLVEITPQANQYTERALIDSLTTNDVIINGEILISSTQFKNVESLIWDTDAEVSAQRYKPNNSEWVFDTTLVMYKDTMDIISYRAVVDTPLIDQGILFVDQAEWVDTTYEYVSNDRMEFSHVFHFQRKQLNSDSLMFRVNTDCNDNGTWDDTETTDMGNGILDPDEPYYDINENGVRDSNEPFEDRNCNDVWDEAETVDAGNGLIDTAEEFSDLNGNGQPDENELFVFNPIPNQLLVTWDDSNNPTILSNIVPGDSLVTRWGFTYRNIIEEIEYDNTKTVFVMDVDSLVTLYTNQVVAHITNSNGTDDYLIVKTEWEDDNTDGKDYDYLLFKQNEHIYKLIKPSFFKPYGYYWSDGQLASGFWFKNLFEDEVLYYTSNGLIREGEIVEESFYDTTTVAIYKIDRSFQVEAEDIIVPAKKVRGIINNEGNVECYTNPAWVASDISDCPGVDTTFVDAFKITNTLTQTMIGTDVEFGEKNITWLVKGYGIVKDELYIRWTEYPMSNGDEQWVGISRWELGRISTTANGGGQLNRLLKRAQAVKINELQSIPELKDPFHIKRTAGLQRVELPR